MRHFILAIMALPVVVAGQTLEECQQAAERNYPLIKQYDLIGKTTDLTVANIGKGWLPQVAFTAQATYQSDVVSWPEQMQSLYQQMGIRLKGLKKDQYRMGIDVSQTVVDGGAISSQKRIAREQGRVEEARNEVTMYTVRQRVNELYFALLLTDEQIGLNNDLQETLAANERKLESMQENGTASLSDLHSVKAERLNAGQQATELQSGRNAISLMLSILCGMEIGKVERPAEMKVEAGNNRPELKLTQAELRLADAQEKALDAALMPKLSLFAQGQYGYPGYNMFEDMLGHDWKLNGMVGVRLTWNIGAFYTRKNDKAKLRLQRAGAENSRDVFLFNNRLEQTQQREAMERYRKLIEDDEEIIALRSSVRKAAESKLSHGIIDVNDLVREIHAENAARVQQAIHEIEWLKEMYGLKYLTNK